MSLFASFVYAGGLVQSRQLGKSWTASIFWPVALGMTLASLSSKHEI